MTRLIDADALVDQLEREAADEWNRNTSTNWANAFCVFVDRLDEAPAIDAAPVRRSEWVTDDDNNDDWAEPYCKKCGCSIPCGPAHFCPNCGSDMRKEDARNG